MAKQIKTRVDYQMTELVSNLQQAATTQSEQKRDFYTTRALYNAKRLESLVSRAKIGAMALIVACSMVACTGGSSTSGTNDSASGTNDSAAVHTDSTAVHTDSTHTDTGKSVK